MMLLRSRALRSKKGAIFSKSAFSQGQASKAKFGFGKSAPGLVFCYSAKKSEVQILHALYKSVQKKSVALATSEDFLRPCAQRAFWPLSACPRASVFRAWDFPRQFFGSGGKNKRRTLRKKAQPRGPYAPNPHG